MTMYEVIPFTSNYSQAINNQIGIFFTQGEAYEYANRFKWVEITTINL